MPAYHIGLGHGAKRYLCVASTQRPWKRYVITLARLLYQTRCMQVRSFKPLCSSSAFFVLGLAQQLFNLLAFRPSSSLLAKRVLKCRQQTWRKTVRGWSALKKNRQCVAPVLWEEDGDGDIRVLANAAVPAIVKTTQDGKIILNPQPSGMIFVQRNKIGKANAKHLQRPSGGSPQLALERRASGFRNDAAAGLPYRLRHYLRRCNL